MINERIKRFSTVCLFIGVFSLFSSLFLNNPERAGFSYLLPYVYFLFLSLGALFFLSVQYVSRAKWSLHLKPIMEAMSSYVPYAAALIVPLIYYGFSVYDWLDPSLIEKDPILKNKTPYLNFPFYIIRLVLFFSVWIFCLKKLIHFSKKKNETKLMHYSVGFLLFFVPSFSLLSVDLLMSLDSHWFSTIFGVYTFSGAFQSALAVMILMTVYFIPKLGGLLDKNHLHDLGKFLMGMTLFWAYIAFSQYMLIWYANLPEETTFFVPRSKGPWMFVSIALIVLKFAVPFLCLLPRWVKRNFKTISALSILILIMQYVDIYWLIYPAYNPDSLVWGFLDIGLFLGFLGLFLLVLFSYKYPRG